MKYKGLTKKDLEFINWREVDIKKIPEEYKKYKKEQYKKIKSIKPNDRTFENTVFALDQSAGPFAQVFNKIETARLMGVGTDKIRKAIIKTEEDLSKISIDLAQDKGIYDSLLEYKAKKQKLTGPDKKLFEDYLRAYERMGFALSETKQKELKKLRKREAKLSSDFSKNITAYKDHIILDKKDTSGLSENYLKTLKKDKKGDYIITLDYPEIGPFVSESDVTEKRKEIIDKAVQKGGRKNLDIMVEILNTRKTAAKLLGYKNHAEYAIEARMAKKLDTVESFLYGLKKKVSAPAKKDDKMVQDMKVKVTGNKKAKLNYYDSAYYETKLEKNYLDMDPETIREYFPLEHVLKNMLEIFGDLYGIKFKKKNTKLWHKDTKMYALIDKKSDKEIAYIAMDLFPREGKYGHACAVQLRDGHQNPEDDNEYLTPITSFLCNFRKPSGKTPSLLSPYEITTMFHEFGHAMHNSLSRTKYASQSGFNVLWDFVELPSQMAERWFFDKKTLLKISKHHKTGKPLPNKDIKNILKSNKFMVAFNVSRQLEMGILDIVLHTKGSKSPNKLWAKMAKETLGRDISKLSLFPASFSHIMNEYDAGYYSYLWSLVYADDVFSEFEKHGIFSKKIGMKYRKEILEVGSSRDEMDSLKAFLGRKPNNKAFIKNILGK